jgi:hypothetical protein
MSACACSVVQDECMRLQCGARWDAHLSRNTLGVS